ARPDGYAPRDHQRAECRVHQGDDRAGHAAQVRNGRRRAIDQHAGRVRQLHQAGGRALCQGDQGSGDQRRVNMTRPEILVIRPIYAPTLAELEREFTVHKLWTARDPDAFMKEVSAGVRGVVTTGLLGFSRSQIEMLPKLEIIASFGNPRGTVDLAVAKERGVIVTNTPDSITETVADLALGLLIAVMRRICESDRFVRAGKWLNAPPP